MPAKNKGIVLFITIGLLFVLSISAAIMLLTAHNHANVTENLISRIRAIMLAEAGSYYAIYKIRGDDAYTGETLEAGSGIVPSRIGWSMTIIVEDYPFTGGKKIRTTIEYPKAAIY